MDVRLKHPMSMCIVGPGFSGKTVFVKKLLSNAMAMIDPPPQKIVWFYGEYQLSTGQKRSLSKYKHKLTKHSNRRTPLKERKRIINQRGGCILPLLMKLAMPALGALALAVCQ